MVSSKLNYYAPADPVARTTTAAELEGLKDLRERLYDSAFDGIISADIQGNLLDCNQAAEDIFEMSAEEMRGKNIRELYFDPKEPIKIRQMLSKSEDGKIRDYQSYVRNSYGNKIPIILSATWMYNQEKQKIGSVGYFRDLRSTMKDERYLKLLQETSQIVAEAESLDRGLEKLVERIVNSFLVSFSIILLLDKDEQILVVKSASAILRKQTLDWTPTIGKRYGLAEFPELGSAMDQGSPGIFRREIGSQGKFIRFLEKELGLKDVLQSVLLVPFKAQSNKVGVSIIGEMRSWQRRPFTERDVELAKTMAIQLAVLIEKIKLNEQARQHLDETDRRNQLLSAPDESSRHIRAERELSRLLHEIVRMSAELLGCPIGCMLLNHRVLAEVEVVAVCGLPNELIGKRFPNQYGFIGKVVSQGEKEVLYQFVSSGPADQILKTARLKSIIGAPIKEMGAVEAVLVVGDRKRQRRFSALDEEILERLMIQASIALQSARLIGKEQRAYAQLSILKKISDYIQLPKDLNSILHVVLTGITAGYGLRFNRAALFLIDEDKSHLNGSVGIGQIDREFAVQDWKRHHLRGLEDFDSYLKALESNQLLETPIGTNIQGLSLALSRDDENAFRIALEEKKPVQITREMLASLPDSFLRAFDPEAPLIVAPLMTREEVLGMIVVDNKFTHAPITEEDLETLMAFANTAAIAIDTQRRFEAVDRNTKLMTSLVTVSQKLTGTLDLNEQMEIVREFAVEDFNAPMFFIGLYDIESDSIDFKIVEDHRKRLKVAKTELAKKESWGVAGYVVKKRTPIQWYSSEEKKREMLKLGIKTRIEGTTCESCFGVPLITGREVLGVISIQSDQAYAWGENELNAFQTLARLAAVAIQNSRLYANLVEVARDNGRLLQQVSRAKRASDVVAEVMAVGKDVKVTLESVVEGTRTATRCDSVVLYVYDEATGLLDHPPTMVGVVHPEKAQRLGKVDEASIVYTMLRHEDPFYISINNREDPFFKDRRFTQEEGIESCIALPLRIGKQRMGVMFVNYWVQHQFTNDEINNIQALANQAAVAIRNAQLYEELQQRVKALEVMNKAGRLVTHSLVIDEIMGQIAEQAYEITGTTGEHASIVSITRLKDNKAVFEAAYPVQDLEKIFNRLGKEIDIEHGINGRIGVIGRTIKTGKAQLVKDTEDDPDYLTSHPETRSEVTVPIMYGDRLIGVISAEHPEVGAFGNDDIRDLETLASYAAIAIEHAEQFEYLNEIKGFIGKTTAVEWIRMVSKTWTHDINKEVGIARLNIERLRKNIDLENVKVSEPFVGIEQAINRIGDIPITAPLSYEDAISQVGIKSLVETYLLRQWDHYPYKLISPPCLDLQPDLDDLATVRTSPEWLRRALEILVENAVQAMLDADSPVKQLTVKAYLVGERIQICIRDTGPGIPEKYLETLFTKTKDDTKGTGVGLVLASTIIQTYYGTLNLQSSGRDGTEMIISLPVEQQVGE